METAKIAFLPEEAARNIYIFQGICNERNGFQCLAFRTVSNVPEIYSGDKCFTCERTCYIDM